jgi:hypothetical protein
VLGECVVKIKDVVQESLTPQQSAYPWIRLWIKKVRENPSIANNPQALLQFAQTIFGNRLNPNQIPAPTNMSQSGVTSYLTNLTGQFLQVAPTPTTQAEVPVAQEPSEFEKEWKVVDKDLGIVKYGSEKFQRDETTGQWISFKTGKPVPQRFVPPLDRALPPTRKTRPQDIPGAWWGQRSRPKV